MMLASLFMLMILYSLGRPALGMVLPTAGWLLLLQLEIKTDMPIGQSDVGNSSIETSPLR